MTPSSLDAVLVSAVDLARSAVFEVAPAAHVGDHTHASAGADLLLTHEFVCLAPGYVGWHWAVTVVRAPEDAIATVAEVVLLPGEGALLAPAWLPWNERVRPGDLGPGDLYPTSPEDPRLEPGYTGLDALEEADATESLAAPLRPEQWELGLGRETVLSALGRDLATERWIEGDFGPDSPMAKAAPGNCRTCGFLLPLGGLVGQAFGLCANPLGADGHVIALDYGCGAHSSVRELEGTGVPVTEIAIDELGIDALDLRSEPLTGADDVALVVDDLADELAEAPLAETLTAEDLAESQDDDDALFAVEDIAPIAEDADLDEDDTSVDDDDEADDDDDSAVVDELADVEDIEPDEILG